MKEVKILKRRDIKILDDDFYIKNLM